MFVIHRLGMIKASVKFHEYIQYGLGFNARTQFFYHARADRGKELGPRNRKRISQSCLPRSYEPARNAQMDRSKT